MKGVVLVVVLLCLLSVPALGGWQKPGAPKRLISTYEGDPGTWMGEEEILNLKAQRIGFMDITDDWNLPQNLAVPTPPPLPNQPQQKALVRSLISQLDEDNVEGTIKLLSSYFNRYYTTETGVEAAVWIHSTAQGMVSSKPNASVRFFNNTFPQPSVIVRMEGSSSNETVIIGAHLDSTVLLFPAGKRAPGADDDASGCAPSLEVLRVLLATGFQPERTLEFHYYAAEEAGLLGSKAIAQSYAEQGVNVVGMLQLDMTGYIGKNGENVVGIVTDNTDPDLTQFVRQLVEAYCDIPWMNTLCGYSCSDHASWEKQGYRAAFPFESQFREASPYIHSAEDTIDNMSVDHTMQFAQLALGFAVELSTTGYMSN